jgi:hypothetical protein
MRQVGRFLEWVAEEEGQLAATGDAGLFAAAGDCNARFAQALAANKHLESA